MSNTTNVDIRVEEEKLIIEIDLTKRFGKSKKGNSEIVATANLPVDNHPGMHLGLNVFTR